MIKRSVMVMVILLLTSASSAPSAWADGMARKQHHGSHHRFKRAYAPRVVHVDYRECYTGWWQGLKFGHVRPRWGTQCRR